MACALSEHVQNVAHVYIRTKIAARNGMLVDIVTCITPQGCVLTCLNQWPLWRHSVKLPPLHIVTQLGTNSPPQLSLLDWNLLVLHQVQLVISCMSTDGVWPHYPLCSLLIVCFSVRLCTTAMLAHEVFHSFLLNWTVSMLLLMRHPRTSLWKTAKQWQQTRPLSENTLSRVIDIPVNSGFF